MSAGGMKQRVKAVFRNARNGLARAYMHTLFVLRPMEKKVVCMSFLGKQYSDNPRAISEKLHALYPDYRIVWVLSDTSGLADTLPGYVSVVKPGIRRYREIATAFCYVTNNNNDPDLAKRRGQFFIQTWHGDGGFKKILYANSKGRTQYVPVADNAVTDICMAGSEYGEQKYRIAFQYQGEILSVGCARNDVLICPDPARARAVRERLSLDGGQKVLLYAPTFRANNRNQQSIGVDLGAVLSHLRARDGCEWVCLVRAHPSARFGMALSGGGIRDVSDYPDMADLLLIADFLITDYSSCASDFALTRRPVVLATFDRQDYSQGERTLNVALEDTGFIYADDQDQLNAIIDTHTEADYADSCERVLRFYGSKETGHASERICEIIDERYRRLRAGD